MCSGLCSSSGLSPPLRVRSPREQGTMPTCSPPSHHLGHSPGIPSGPWPASRVCVGLFLVHPLKDRMCHGMHIPKPKEWPRGGCLGVCKWSLDVWAGGLRPTVERKGTRSEERKGIVHGPGTRALCNTMFGHRTWPST